MWTQPAPDPGIEPHVIETAAAMLPFALAGAFLPTWTIFVIIFLGTTRPASNAAAFILGNATFRLGLGLFVLFVTPVAVPELPQGAESSGLTGIVYGVAALLFALMAFGQFRHRNDPPRPMPGWVSSLERMPPIVAFGFGFITVAAPGIQYVYFLGGMSVLAGASLNTPETLVLLVLFVAFLEIMLVVPLGIFLLFRRRAEELLARFKNWIEVNNRATTAVILALLALYFGYRAIAIYLL
jgi:hypothetical protein